MPELVYNVKFQIDTNIQEGAAGVTAYKEKVEDLTAELANANAQIDRMRKGGGKNGADPFKNLNQGAVNAGKSFSIANQAVFSLSDGIQDATQFSQGFSQGMRAIGNNIGFTTELMANLGRRVDEYNKENGTAITRTDAFREAIFKLDKDGNVLRNSFGLMKLSATGFVLALNVGLTALTYLTTAISNYNKKSKEATESTSDFTNAVKQFYDLSRDSSVTQLSSLEREVEFYQRRVTILQEETDLKEQQNAINRQLGSSQGVYNKNLLDELDFVNKKIASNKELQNQFGIQQSDYDDLNKNLQKANANYNAFTKGTSESGVQLGLLVSRIKDANIVIANEYNLGINKTNKGVLDQIEYLKNLKNSFTLLAQGGQTELIPVINQISDQISKLTEETMGKLADSFSFDFSKLGTREFKSQVSFLRDTVTGELAQVAMPSSFIELSFISEMGFDLADELNESFNKKSETFQEESLDRRLSDMNRFNEQMKQMATDKQAEENAIMQMEIFRAESNIRSIEDFENYYQKRNDILDQHLRDNLISQAEYDLKVLQLDTQRNNARVQMEQSAASMILGINSNLASSITGLLSSAFQNNKAIAIAETIVSTYFAAQQAYAATLAGATLNPFTSSIAPALAKKAAISAVLQGAARVAAIAATEIGSKSVATSGGGGGSSAGAFGFQMNKIEGPQTFRTPAFAPTNGDRRSTPKVDVRIMADRKQLYAIVKQGEEEYRQIKV